MKLISVVTTCYNEEENVEELYLQVKSIFCGLKNYNYEHIFIDNASQDKTVSILKRLAKEDKNLKIIVNIKNFGQNRSPYYALLQSKGDAVILMSADFQDPPELIKAFIAKWEEGYKVVLGVREKSKENGLMPAMKKFYYFLINKISDVPQIKNFTGFGLYVQSFIDILRRLDEPSPYFRGLIADFGTERTEIKFVQPKRQKGRSHNNFYTLFDIAMLGFVNHSILPLRIASFIGCLVAIFSFITGVIYFIYKLTHWMEFQTGIAPLVIGVFFFSSVQLFFIGILGEYIGATYTQVKKKAIGYRKREDKLLVLKIDCRRLAIYELRHMEDIRS